MVRSYWAAGRAGGEGAKGEAWEDRYERGLDHGQDLSFYFE